MVISFDALPASDAQMNRHAAQAHSSFIHNSTKVFDQIS